MTGATVVVVDAPEKPTALVVAAGEEPKNTPNAHMLKNLPHKVCKWVAGWNTQSAPSRVV